jgi:L-glutamine-phosphate cytidylyltransferase
MKAIIVAAGMGRRLQPYTDDRPKCLVEINGRAILHRQIDAYRACGVDELVLVRGYRKDQIVVPGARTFDNDQFRENNILTSLFYAEEAMAGGFLFSYSDIVFRPEAVRAALDTPGDFSLVIDRRWMDAYHGRKDHPVEEGEVARVSADGRVELVGKKTVPANEASGEFIGLARFSARAVEKMRERFHARKRELLGKPYGRAPKFEVAYLTDLLNDLISSGEEMRAAYIDGGWREIDTVEDLERAKPIVTW